MKSLKDLESIGKREAAELARIKAVGLRTAAALKRHPDSAGLQRQRARLAAQWSAQNKRVEELRAQYDAARKAQAPATKQVSEATEPAPSTLSQRDKEMILRGYEIAVTQVSKVAYASKNSRNKTLRALADELAKNAYEHREKLS